MLSQTSEHCESSAQRCSFLLYLHLIIYFFPSKKPGVHLKLPCHIQHAACSNLQHKFLTFEGLKANHTLTCMTKPCLQTCLPLSPLVLILAGDVSIKLLQSFLSVVMCKPCSAMCNNKSATCLQVCANPKLNHTTVRIKQHQNVIHLLNLSGVYLSGSQ